MLRLKEGDNVRIVDRSATAADLKSGLFYNYYRNLSGTVFKVYGTDANAQIAIDVDIETLPEDVSRRHFETRDAIRAGLTGEAKRQSGPGMDQEFRLRYVILVCVNDLVRRTVRPRATNGSHPALLQN